MTLLSAKIREVIKEKGISAHALEKQAGLKPSAVQNILYGRSKNPSISTLNAIAQALGCSITVLIGNPEQTWTENRKNNPFELSETTNSHWNHYLYLDALEITANIARRSAKDISKESLLALVDEVYLYSLNNKERKADCYFAQWLFDHHGYI